MILCISQRDGLHVVPLPRIDKLIGQGVDLAIQAERGTAMSVSHLSDHYTFYDIVIFPQRTPCLVFAGIGTELRDDNTLGCRL